MEDLLDATISDLKAAFFGQENRKELLSRVEDIIPIESQKYNVVSVKGNDVRFKATIKTNYLKDEDDITNFVKNYRVKNAETFQKQRNFKIQRANIIWPSTIDVNTIRGMRAQCALKIFWQQSQTNDSRTRTVHFLLLLRLEKIHIQKILILQSTLSGITIIPFNHYIP
jgi:hypothetical protein